VYGSVDDVWQRFAPRGEAALLAEFPTALSDSRFVEFLPRVLVPLAASLHT
jgi:hypothetical protein